MAVACGLATLGFGGCAQSPQQLAAASHGKEYFPSSIYGPASRRVIADGQPVPRGGGQYLVGKPYTVAGQTYYPSERHIVQVGNASWYGDAFHGRLTANGEIYDRDGFTAAHPTMPLPSYARVTNLRNHYSMVVRVNDRGPYASSRIMDVSRRVAEALDFKRYGTARIKVEYVGRASLAGSDDAKLYATLRTDGPARWPGEPTMVAAAAPRTRVASLAAEIPIERPRFAGTPEDAEAPLPRRRARMAMREAQPARDDDARPDAVEAAYRRFGSERELPRKVSRDISRDRAREFSRDFSRDLPHAPARMRPSSRYASARDGEEGAMMRTGSARRRDEGRLAVLAERAPAPHLPIRSLIASTRYDGGNDAPFHAMRYVGRPIVPPLRPLDLGAVPGAPRHRVVELRTVRYRDD